MISTHVLNRGWGAVRGPADTVLRPLTGPSLATGGLRALDCGAPRPSTLASLATEEEDRVCWREDSALVGQFIGAR